VLNSKRWITCYAIQNHDIVSPTVGGPIYIIYIDVSNTGTSRIMETFTPDVNTHSWDLAYS